MAYVYITTGTESTDVDCRVNTGMLIWSVNLFKIFIVYRVLTGTELKNKQNKKNPTT